MLGIGLLSIESADARYPLIKAIVPSPSTNLSQSSSNKISQLSDPNSPLYGIWKLKYSVDGIIYQSLLVMNGYSGNMRTRYYHPRLGTQVVDQTIYLKSSPDGLILLGSDPVYAGTSRRNPYYSADNFLFSIEPDGSTHFITCDYNKRCSSVGAQKIR